jgi:hypothetical protein
LCSQLIDPATVRLSHIFPALLNPTSPKCSMTSGPQPATRLCYLLSCDSVFPLHRPPTHPPARPACPHHTLRAHPVIPPTVAGNLRLGCLSCHTICLLPEGENSVLLSGFHSAPDAWRKKDRREHSLHSLSQCYSFVEGILRWH